MSDELRREAEYVIGYCEDSCMALPSGPCEFENRTIKLLETILDREQAVTRLVEAAREAKEMIDNMDEEDAVRSQCGRAQSLLAAALSAASRDAIGLCDALAPTGHFATHSDGLQRI